MIQSVKVVPKTAIVGINGEAVPQINSIEMIIECDIKDCEKLSYYIKTAMYESCKPTFIPTIKEPL